MSMRAITDRVVIEFNRNNSYKKCFAMQEELNKSLTKEQSLLLLDLVDEYGLTIYHACTQSYKKGLHEGFSLAKFFRKIPLKSKF